MSDAVVTDDVAVRSTSQCPTWCTKHLSGECPTHRSRGVHVPVNYEMHPGRTTMSVERMQCACQGEIVVVTIDTHVFTLKPEDWSRLTSVAT